MLILCLLLYVCVSLFGVLYSWICAVFAGVCLLVGCLLLVVSRVCLLCYFHEILLRIVVVCCACYAFVCCLANCCLLVGFSC